MNSRPPALLHDLLLAAGIEVGQQLDSHVGDDREGALLRGLERVHQRLIGIADVGAVHLLGVDRHGPAGVGLAGVHGLAYGDVQELLAVQASREGLAHPILDQLPSLPADNARGKLNRLGQPPAHASATPRSTRHIENVTTNGTRATASPRMCN